MSKVEALIIAGLMAIALFIGITATDAKPVSDSVLILSDKNTVNLNMPIIGEYSRDVQLALIQKSRNLKASESIYLFLNSPGGSIESGFQIIETAKGLPNQVHTVSLFSASMSFVISQLLDERFVLPYATLMSHRAYLTGLEGQVPGSFVSRLEYILGQLLTIDTQVATRAGMTVKDYQSLIRDEAWFSAGTAKRLRFADKIVDVRCDKTLDGTVTKNMRVLFFNVKVDFSKCPLITHPLKIEVENTEGDKTALIKALRAFFYDKPRFLEEYVRTGKMAETFR